MIFVFLGIGILSIILGHLMNLKKEDSGFGLFIVGVIMNLITVIAIACLLISVSKSYVIDEKMSMYQKENANIETSIAKIVENYKDYEKEIFKDAKPEEVITIATQIYPELKSNTLVEKQINIYLENNKKIKELKEDRINFKVHKWWLYFGGWF